MIDLHLLRTDLDKVTAALARRGWTSDRVDELVQLDVRRRELIVAVDDARAAQKQASKAIGSASKDDRPALIAAAAELKTAVTEQEETLAVVQAELDQLAATVPNHVEDDAPDGNEGDGITLRTIGEKPSFDFETKDHVALMEAAGALDLEAARKVSGSRFAYLKGQGALLEFALVRYAMDIAMAHGHVPVIPPVLVREEAMYATGFFPTDEQQIFAMRDDDLFLVGTAEVPLAGLHMDEILDAADLPLRYVGFSTAFRREAGTYGKDTTGIFRVHQFDKVELFSFVTPDASQDEHRRLLAIEEEVMSGLGLHFNVVDIPVGDLGSSAARKFDIEAWLPGQEQYRELTSTSNTTDFQARRLKCRMREEQGGDTIFVHTLNGTALAVGRTIIAVVETHQRADGSVAVPPALQSYLGTDVLFAQA